MSRGSRSIWASTSLIWIADNVAGLVDGEIVVWEMLMFIGDIEQGVSGGLYWLEGCSS